MNTVWGWVGMGGGGGFGVEISPSGDRPSAEKAQTTSLQFSLRLYGCLVENVIENGDNI